MRAAVFERSGLDNLQVSELPKPKPGPREVLVRVVESGVNPIDYYTVTSLRVKPIPHIPGAEFAGIVEEVGEHVEGFSPGDRVVVYGRVFDGTCDMCLASMEHLCRNGGIVGVVTNGGWAEYATVPSVNLVKLPQNVDWVLAASLPVAALTSYHALRLAGVKPGELVVVMGASGNTGQFAVQLAKLMGATVVAVSRKGWVKELGADYVTTADKVIDLVGQVSEGKMADVVVDPLGKETWSISLRLLGRRGRLVTFGQLTGGDVQLTIGQLYGIEASVIGSTGGTRRELLDLVKMASSGKLKVKVYREYGLGEVQEALKALVSRDRDGRVMLRIQ